MLICNDCLEENIDKSILPSFSTHSHSSRQASKEAPSVPPSKQRFHKLQFLQELSGQKPCWDEARLYSLVNKQVGTYSDNNNSEEQEHLVKTTRTPSEDRLRLNTIIGWLKAK